MAEEESFLKEAEALHNLRALEAIEKNPKISQRELSSRLGVALGITNSLLKALVRKGQIKIRGENNRSLTYHVTHTGMLVKSALALKWTVNMIDFYRNARRDVAASLANISADGVETILLFGLNDVSEIAVLVAREAGVEIKGCILSGAEDDERHTLLELPIGGDELIGETGADAIVTCISREPDIEEKISGYRAQGHTVYSLI